MTAGGTQAALASTGGERFDLTPALARMFAQMRTGVSKRRESPTLRRLRLSQADPGDPLTHVSHAWPNLFDSIEYEVGPNSWFPLADADAETFGFAFRHTGPEIAVRLRPM